MTDSVKQPIRYNAWANSAAFEALLGLGEIPARARAAFIHILETEIVWTRRIDRRSDANVPQWTDRPDGTVRQWLAECRSSLQRIVGKLDLVDWTFTYRNFSGRVFTSPVVLEHVLLHWAQYRGEHPAPAVHYSLPT